MNITLLKAKIHRAVVKQADLDYVGSITIDSDLLRESGILEYEKVEIADIDNGNRFETYAIAGEAGSGIIIIMAYAQMTPEEAKTHKPTVLFVDQDNHIVRKANYEKHGLLIEQ